MTTTIDASRLIADARKLAAEHPDATYVPVPGVGCLYASGVAGPGVGCIFGQAMRMQGVDPAEFDDGDCTKNINAILRVVGEATSEQRDWCLRVQGAQDDGLTWSEAVRHASSEELAETVQ